MKTTNKFTRGKRSRTHLAMYPPCCAPWPATPGPSPPPIPFSSPDRHTASSSFNLPSLSKQCHFECLYLSTNYDKSIKNNNLFQNLGKTPQQSSIPLSAFSAACMSLLMETRPASIFSSCSEHCHVSHGDAISLLSFITSAVHDQLAMMYNHGEGPF